MAFLRNDAINRVNVHSGIQALAQGAGGVFVLVFLLRAGFSIPAVLIVQASMLAGRFVLRPVLLPIAKRLGLKPLLITGTLLLALQYPVLAEVTGVNLSLFVFMAVMSVAEIFYYPVYNAYFAAVGDTEHRGHQIAAREALVAIVGIVAPLLGAWALVTAGPRMAFAGVGLVQAAAAIPLFGIPNVAVRQHASGAFHAALLGATLVALDGWFDAIYLLLWQIGLFTTLGESYAAYGGAMALAGIVGAACGLLLGPLIDRGGGRRAVIVAMSAATALLLFRAASFDAVWLAVTANALGAALWPLLLPALGAAVYNLAKASPCPFRFNIAVEAGWDIGCASACLLAAALVSAGTPLALVLLLALPAVAASTWLLWRYYPPAGDATATVTP